jgi:phosphonate transport system substrate-binding protein
VSHRPFLPWSLAGVGLVAAAFLLVAFRSVDEKPPLRFSGIPNQNTTELNEKYKPLAEHFSKELGVKVEYVPSVDYNASVDAFKNGDVQLCWFGGYTGVQAREAVKGAKAIACGKRDTAFKSYFIAHKDAGLSKSTEFPMAMKGRTFTFGSAQSTSGRLMPEYHIRKHAKLSPKEFFGAEPNYSGSHDKTIELVAAKAFEFGVVDYTVYEKRVAEKKIDPAQVVVVWETPPYADYNFTAHPLLDVRHGQGFTDKLQKALVAISDEKLLAPLDRKDGLIACDDKLFEDLKKTAKEIGLLR